jgi:hypothetical protein
MAVSGYYTTKKMKKRKKACERYVSHMCGGVAAEPSVNILVTFRELGEVINCATFASSVQLFRSHCDSDLRVFHTNCEWPLQD